MLEIPADMNVCVVNTYERTGGAAIACLRLTRALQSMEEVNADLLVAMGQSDDPMLIRLDRTFAQRMMNKFHIALERILFKPYHNGEINAFYFSPARNGRDISKHEAIRRADIIHLHWTNLGFLSIEDIERLAALGKPIVWTLHDMWAFTGGCHYSGDCENFTTGCGHCERFLRRPGPHDLSRKINGKKSFFKDFHFVTSSKWLMREAKKSSILRDAHVESITIPIDIKTFQPQDRTSAKEALNLDAKVSYILFGAANLDDERKGFSYLLQALDLLKVKYPDLNPEILLFGRSDGDTPALPYKVHSLGSIGDEPTMATIYNAADLFVIPSMQDNLPNTIIEAHACGTPVVGFDAGGIPEMVEHKQNGYVAAFKDTEDLAEGIRWVLTAHDMRDSARAKALADYDPEVVKRKYYAFYQSIIQKH